MLPGSGVQVARERVVQPVRNEPGPKNPPMSWEGIDHALNRAQGEEVRFSLYLADLDQHVSHRLLRETNLVGRTRRRWDHAKTYVHDLWKVHDAFAAVLERATELRGSERADGALQNVLTEILTGPSIEIRPEKQPPGEQHPSEGGVERLTTAEAIARMESDFYEATEVISAVETVWDALYPRLSELEATWQEIGTLSDMVGLDEEEYEELRGRLRHSERTVRQDPLRLVEDGRVDTSVLEESRVLLERVRGELRDALRMRDSYAEGVERLNSAIDDVQETIERCVRLRQQVVMKIASPVAVSIPNPIPELRRGIAEMGELRTRGRWRELGALLGGLQRKVHEAADNARESEANLTGLLERRAELRGRLNAYRAWAVRLGLADRERLSELHGQVHRELWATPCDLRAATVALASYLRVLQELSGNTSLTERTISGTWASDRESDGGVSR